MFRFRVRNVPDPAVQMNFEQLAVALPIVGSVLVTFPAIAAGGAAVQGITVAEFRGFRPVLVIAQMTTGGTIFFSNQYVIGTYNYRANGFDIAVGSGWAIGAGWTAQINYVAYFQAT